MKREHIKQLYAISLFVVSMLLFLSFISYTPDDLPFYTSSPNKPAKNFIGIFGAYIAGAFFFLFGKAAFLIPVLCFLWSLSRFFQSEMENLYIKLTGTIIFLCSSSSLLSLLFSPNPIRRFNFGGFIGLFVSNILIKYFGRVGSYILTLTFILLSLLISTEFIIFPYIDRLFKFIKSALSALLSRQKEEERISNERSKPIIKIREELRKEKLPTSEEKPKIKPAVIIKKEIKEKMEPVFPRMVSAKRDTGDYKLPSLELLDSPPPIEERKIKEDLENSAKVLEETLGDFGIEAKAVDVERGPVITMYELEPAPGVKVQRIASLSDDIALAMKAISVRVVAPIPGKSRVGVEVPNTITTLVYLKEVLSTQEFQGSSSKLTLALGKDVSGGVVIADLSEMPHLLIAGTTGSGKTVCVNSLITSMLFNATPDEMKFLMVDPKMVELAVFNGLPHLLCPVLTDPKKVSGALGWVVNEMEERYKLFAKLGVRNINIYNERFQVSKEEKEDKEITRAILPYIVVIIDELADLMLIASRDIEEAITRLAQLSRAVGIHIILATQRPSVDVITGVIKANFPARISFKVASKVDSRTVLDMNGADKLLGRGDMLFLKPGQAKPIRAQGCLISDNEIEKIVNFIKEQREPLYDEEILKEREKRYSMKDQPKDELFEEAAKLVIETGQASISILQRRLRLGYTRAARLIDMMEEEGIIGPFRGSKPREILVNNVEEIGQKKEEEI
ncbi:MAG: DNA translocase FtsK [Candidatus Omnitrophica bacterium]|nr:DNA translocase FtsK [Candidatus Omnitrophota bacterium]